MALYFLDTHRGKEMYEPLAQFSGINKVVLKVYFVKYALDFWPCFKSVVEGELKFFLNGPSAFRRNDRKELAKLKMFTPTT